MNRLIKNLLISEIYLTIIAKFWSQIFLYSMHNGPQGLSTYFHFSVY